MNLTDIMSYFGELAPTATSDLVIAIVIAVISTLLYVMTALAFFTIARYRGIANAWLAWIPVGQLWVLGSISDLYQETENNKKTNRGKKLLLLTLIPLVVCLVSTAIVVIAALNATNPVALLVAAILCLVVNLVALGFSIWGAVLQYMSIFDVYRSNDAESALLYLLVGMFIPFMQPFLLLSTCDRIASRDYTKIVVKFFTYLFLLVMAVIVLFPFYWMIISSLKSLEEYKRNIPTFWPTKIMFSNYAKAFTAANLGRLFLNTMIVGVVSTLLSLVITVLSAFAFARLEFKGRDALFTALLATMMIPGELFTITNYATVSRWGWLDSYQVLIIPFLVSVFYIFLLRQNFLQIPNELYLAAKVDGTSDLKYLWKVMVPLALPTLISITILKMMGAWNSYIWPRLVTKDKAYELITNGLRNAFTDASGNVDFPVQMAAVALVSAPLFLVFIFLRKYIMAGVSRSGIKG